MQGNRLRLTVLLTVLTFSAGAVSVAQQIPGNRLTDVDFTWGVKIPVRDGVKLNATVLKPRPFTGPVPVIFTFTPYIGDSYFDRAMYFARHGYIYALVDVRGRGNSEGKFEPFVNEGRDGADVVEWLAKQPWCNGKVTMWGGSYAGFDQWSVLKEFPSHLATIVPAAAAHAGVDFPMQNNFMSTYLMQWLSFTSGATSNQKLFEDGAFWQAKARELFLSHRPFAEYDQIVGNSSTVFQKWIAHPTPDAYYDAMVPNAEEYKRIKIPILTITGDYDGDQLGAMTYYRRHMQYGSAEAIANHFLIIGPWDHAGTRTPNRDVGGLHFGEASMLDLNKLHTDWYNWTMKNGAKPEFLKKRIAYYLMGAEEWKFADSLEAIADGKLTFYLDSNGSATDAFHSGTMHPQKPSGATSDSFTYDPLDTRAAEEEPGLITGYLLSQRDAVQTYGNAVVYHSAPFTQATELTGYLKFTAWMALDVSDTDFEVAVYELMPDGTSIYLTGDQMRARYRESLRQEKLVKPGEVMSYVFDNFTFVSRRVAKGSRLRLLLRAPNSVGQEKNYNSGGVVAQESGKDARTAHITLYHDAEHPSVLEVPFVK